jgi:hypothetical protein
MASHQRKHVQDETILANVAESIGSTLGTIAAKARTLSHSSFVRTAEREGKKFDGKGKTIVRKVKKAASKNPKKPKSKRTGRRSLHPRTIVGKQAARAIVPRKKTAHRTHRIRRRK